MAWAMSWVMGVRSGEASRTRYSNAISYPRRMAEAGQANLYSLDKVFPFSWFSRQRHNTYNN